MKVGSTFAKGLNGQEFESGCFETKSGSYISYSRLGEKQMLEGRKNTGKQTAQDRKGGNSPRVRRAS